MSEDCPFCLYEKTEENCPGCFEGSNYRPKPITNADRIRSMSDEELAIEETAKGGCPHDCETPDDLDTDCVRCWLDWLKQEVDNG